MKGRNAQAAMEFLMTYGWAILVVLVAIGALAYFGVLSPDNFLPERCTGPAGMDCLDKADLDATNNNMTFILKNNLGFSITNVNATAVSDSCTLGGSSVQLENTTAGSGYTVLPFGTTAPNNKKIKFAVQCSNDFVAGRFKSDITIAYRNSESGLDHKASVSVIGRAV